MSSATPIFGFTRPSSDDYAHLLGDDMGATVDRLEAVLYGMGVRVSPDATALAAEVTARQALAARVVTLEAPPTVVAFPFAAGFSSYTGAGWQVAQLWTRPLEAGLRGTAVTASALTAQSAYTIGTLPVGSRPAGNEKFVIPLYGSAEGNGSILVNATGVMQLVPWQAVPAGQTITLSGPRWFRA